MEPVVTAPAGNTRSKSTSLMVVLFVAVVVIGLYITKWSPSFERALVAASGKPLGASSIISGKAPAAPTPSLQAAWGYTLTYFGFVWKPAILGILVGSLLQVLVPRDWLFRLLGRRSFRTTLLAGVGSVPFSM